MLTITPTNPAPEGIEAFEISALDGVRLRVARCPARRGPRRGTITLIQGRAEYIEKYFETATNLTAAGFDVILLDSRGQGGSQRLLTNPRKGHVARFDHYERDLEAVVSQVLPQAEPPHYALAHSQGALMLFRALARKPWPFERAVLAAPLFGLGSLYEPVGTAVALAQMTHSLGFGRAFVPSAGATPVDWQPFERNVVTSDPIRFARNAAVIEANPAIGLGGPTIGWVNAAVDAMEDAGKAHFADKIGTPCLIVTAGNDVIVSNRAIEAVSQRLRTGRSILIDGAKHELMMERDVFREPFLAAVDAYFP
jgi:lysophospholipase